MSIAYDWKRIRDYHWAFWHQLNVVTPGIWISLEWGPQVPGVAGSIVLVGTADAQTLEDFRDRADKIIQILRTYPTVTKPNVRLVWKVVAKAVPPPGPAPGPYEPVFTPQLPPTTPPSDNDYEILA